MYFIQMYIYKIVTWTKLVKIAKQKSCSNLKKFQFESSVCMHVDLSVLIIQIVIDNEWVALKL